MHDNRLDYQDNSKSPSFPSFSSVKEEPTISIINKAPELDKILATAVDNKASDIHLSINSPVLFRIDGDLTPLDEYPDNLTGEWIKNVLQAIMSPVKFKEYQTNLEQDLSYTVEGYGRFRVNAFHQRNEPASVFRTIPEDIKSLEDLGMSSLKTLTEKPQGLVLVTGPTGSGKSTTLAAMIDSINATRPDHIVTIEDPIEFVHKNKRSLVNQREVGSDTKNFAEALKRVLRQDPDVILVGELRDPETISIALSAAETGHLVFGTLHTQSASKTINRIVDSFPSHQQNQVKTQLSDTLQAVVAQTLLKKEGGGRIAATEILRRNSAIASNIREGNISGIDDSITMGSSYGMHSLDQNLKSLVEKGLVSKEEAKKHLIDENALDGISSSSSEDSDFDSYNF